MDKMDKNFFKYTILLISVAIIFIVIGGISVSRAGKYEDSRVINFGTEKISAQEKLERIEEALESGTDEEIIIKIKDIVKEQ